MTRTSAKASERSDHDAGSTAAGEGAAIADSHLNSLGLAKADAPHVPCEASAPVCLDDNNSRAIESSTSPTPYPSLPVEFTEAVDEAWAEFRLRVSPLFSAVDFAEIRRAFITARNAHGGQTRASGEPYITHPLAVAEFCAIDLGLDRESVMAAIMHDVIEDTDVTREMMLADYGDVITHLVEGVTKLSNLSGVDRRHTEAESFSKLILAMIRDVRVILVKLADRVHNMRTIGAMRPEKRRAKGLETLASYAPIAGRLGIFGVKNELEELSFKAAYPMRYRIIKRTLEALQEQRAMVMDELTEAIVAGCEELGVGAFVSAREKNSYSIYRKLQRKKQRFDDLRDTMAVNVIVNTVDDCYRVLGVIHGLYQPDYSRFKDYIAVPKSNGYQSLHTTVRVSRKGEPVEIQIRTRDMNDAADTGVATHWSPRQEATTSGDEGLMQDDKRPQDSRLVSEPSTQRKKKRRKGADTANDRKVRDHVQRWLRRLEDLKAGSANSVEFQEEVQFDAYPGEIFVFSPKGEIFQLPRGATPVDFAYAVHSQVGNTCVSAWVDDRLFSLSDPLESGQTVRIVTNSSAEPSPLWLNSVTTSKARSGIRAYHRDLDHNRARTFGQRLLRRALTRFRQDYDAIPAEQFEALAVGYQFQSHEELLVAMGRGSLVPSQIAQRLMELLHGEQAKSFEPVEEVDPVQIHDNKEPSLSLPHCCHPLPGDPIRGYMTHGEGIVVHRVDCANGLRLKRKGRTDIDVAWAKDVQGDFLVLLQLRLTNEPGSLAEVTETLGAMRSNIEHMEFSNRSEDNTQIRCEVLLQDLEQLEALLAKLRTLPSVWSAERL